MIKSDISIWGSVLVVLLLMISVAVFALIDRREMQRMLKVFGLLAGQSALAAAAFWLVYRFESWWVCLLWLMLMFCLALAWCLYAMRAQWQQLLLPMALALLAGTFVSCGSLALCVPKHFFFPVAGILMMYLSSSVIGTLQTYQRSLMHTEAHRQYMLANGATPLESLMPRIRRALRAAVQPHLKKMAQPLLAVVPLLFGGMLLGGASPAAAFIVTLLLSSAALSGALVAAIVAVYCFKR